MTSIDPSEAWTHGLHIRRKEGGRKLGNQEWKALLPLRLELATFIFWNSHASYCATKLVIHAYVCQEWQALLPVRLELMAFIMWDWRTTYCAIAACRSHKMTAISLSFFLKKCWLWWPHSCHFCRMKNMDNYCILHIFFLFKICLHVFQE